MNLVFPYYASLIIIQGYYRKTVQFYVCREGPLDLCDETNGDKQQNKNQNIEYNSFKALPSLPARLTS